MRTPPAADLIRKRLGFQRQQAGQLEPGIELLPAALERAALLGHIAPRSE